VEAYYVVVSDENRKMFEKKYQVVFEDKCYLFFYTNCDKFDALYQDLRKVSRSKKKF